MEYVQFSRAENFRATAVEIRTKGLIFKIYRISPTMYLRGTVTADTRHILQIHMYLRSCIWSIWSMWTCILLHILQIHMYLRETTTADTRVSAATYSRYICICEKWWPQIHVYLRPHTPDTYVSARNGDRRYTCICGRCFS